MRWLITFILLSHAIVTCSQSFGETENGAGFNFTSSDFDGLGVSLRLSRNIMSSGTLKFELNSNFSGSNNIRVGYEFLRLRLERLELGVGIDLKYGRKDFTIYNFGHHNYLLIQLPIEFRLHFNPSYSVFSGISYSKKIWSNTGLINSGTSPEFRVGVMYNY